MKTINLQINSPSRRNMKGKTNKQKLYQAHHNQSAHNNQSSDQEKPLKQPEKKNKKKFYIGEQM